MAFASCSHIVPLHFDDLAVRFFVSFQMPRTKDPHSNVTALGLLAFNPHLLVQYLKRNVVKNNGFDISGLLGLEYLSNQQRNELAEKLM